MGNSVMSQAGMERAHIGATIRYLEMVQRHTGADFSQEIIHHQARLDAVKDDDDTGSEGNG